MQLSRLANALQGAKVTGNTDNEITDIAYDSRQAVPGSLFCAIRGFKLDGHEFIHDAISRGAQAVCLEKELSLPEDMVKIQVSDSRDALARLAAEFFYHPSKMLKVIGVTGTNGKTTTTSLIEHILNMNSIKTGLMGTLQTKIGDEIITSKITTPESCDLQRSLSRMVSKGMECAVMEVSSHASVLKRVAACHFTRGVFTNLTQDHLDFHSSLEEYFQAKLDFLASLESDADNQVILNCDDPWAGKIAGHLKIPCVTYGVRNESSGYCAQNVKIAPEGASFDLKHGSSRRRIRLAISGLFNVYNALAAIATTCSLGLSLDEVIQAAGEFNGVKGRFQLVRAGQDFSVVVDYAHTPDGLENILCAAREITDGALIAVFGCGGDRDNKKRPLMGRIAATHADSIIITSDNPRTEDPEKIICDIEAGVKERGKKYQKITDRKGAIAQALDMAKPGDTVVIAGKGHENYQIFRDRTIHFDDVEVVEEYFNA